MFTIEQHFKLLASAIYEKGRPHIPRLEPMLVKIKLYSSHAKVKKTETNQTQLIGLDFNVTVFEKLVLIAYDLANTTLSALPSS